VTTLEHDRIAGADVRWYRPSDPTGDTMVWLHGGGFVMGSIRMAESDAVARGLAFRGCTVLTLDYSLSPIPGIAARGRAAHPTALRQAVAAVLEARRGTPGRLTLGGASAGACLAAATILAVHDAAAEDGTGPLVDAGAFVYGYFHRDLSGVPADIQAKRRGHRRIVHDPRVLRVLNGMYAPVLPAVGERDAFPGGADLTGFPPSLLVDADHDVFRASSERFARELREHGAEVTQRIMSGSDHGFLNRPRSRYFEPTLDALAAFARP
jgi:acetyl esterase/lipase